MALEIEKRYLLITLPPVAEDEFPWQLIRQGYLAIDEYNEVRLREVAGHFSLTVKKGSGVAREEVELELSGEQFALLWPLTAGRHLEKQRKTIPLAQERLYIDEYMLPVNFLLAEVEFDSEEDAHAFVPPDYFGPEVTDIATMQTFPALIERVMVWKKTGR